MVGCFGQGYTVQSFRNTNPPPVSANAPLPPASSGQYNISKVLLEAVILNATIQEGLAPDPVDDDWDDYNVQSEMREQNRMKKTRNMTIT